MPKIVDDPRSYQFRCGDYPELGVETGHSPLSISQIQVFEKAHVVGAQPLEIVQQIRDGLAGALLELGKAIERFEWLRFSVLEDVAKAWDPVGLLPMDEVANDIVSAPCAFPFRNRYPWLGELTA